MHSLFDDVELMRRIAAHDQEALWARVTDEPEYGSDQPTGTVVVHGEL